MKTALRLGVVLAALLPLGCGSLGSFEVDFPADGAIQGNLESPEFAAYKSVGNTFSQTMSSKGVSGFKSAKLSSGSLTIQAQGIDGDVVQGFKVEIAATGQPTVTIAHQDAAAFASKPANVPLVIDDVELKPYFQASDVTFKATPTTSRRPTFPISLHIDLKAKVQVL